MNAAETRIVADVEELDYGQTLQFFQDRAGRAERVGLLSTTMYQDRHPELAQARDAYEKQQVTPLLGLQPRMRVLDIGCGSGRWGLHLLGRVRSYLGVDFSDRLVRLAEAEIRRHGAGDAFQVQTLGATEIAAERLSQPPPFDLFLISGLMTYLNDADCARLLARVAELAADRARVYIREPMALAERLTLKQHYSADLGADYHAIYRTRSEYGRLLDAALPAPGCRVLADAELYDQGLCNREETRQRILLLERNADA
jgi:SAM-dependent methyltransferase